MNADVPPTVRDVAARAGVDKMTVTRALRGDLHVSAKTRAKVIEAAAAIGYCPNPAASTFMSHIRRRRVAAYRGKIAWLDTGAEHPPIGWRPWTCPPYEGVRHRAEQAGYLVDVIWMNDPSLKADRLTELLLARGVQGLIIPEAHPYLDQIDWSHFACATILPSALAPPIHLAYADLMYGVRESLLHLRRSGYRRIGMMLHAIHDWNTNGGERAGYLLETADQPATNRVPVLILPDRAEELDHIARFGSWVREHQPDAVMCSDEYVLDWAHKLNIAVPGELGLVHLNRHPYLNQWAGIDQHEEQIGAAAVDLVVGQLVRGELGLPAFQKEVFIKGKWVEGPTLRPSPTASGG